MINHLLTCGAVPMGYTIDFDSEYTELCQPGHSENCSVADIMMNLANFRSPTGLHHHHLPDLILSNTPPSSPLRRAHSYNFLFPEKGEDQQRRPFNPVPPHHLQRALSCLPTPPPTPTSPREEDDSAPCSNNNSSRCRCSSSEGPDQPQRKGDPDIDNARTGLGHIQEVRRRPDNPSTPHQSLPQLTWDVPRVQRSRRVASPPGESEGIRPLQEEEVIGGGRIRGGEVTAAGGVGGEGGEGGLSQGTPDSREQRLRQIGADLRRIADQFQVDNGKQVASKKNGGGGDSGMTWTVPAAFTKCLSVSLLCLVWWRLVNKLH